MVARPADPPPGANLGAPLPLGSLPLGTFVTDQFAKDGILFSGQSPFITNDGSSSVNPTLSGSPLFSGTVVGTFVKPGTHKPATVDAFSINVGFIDNPGSTQMTVYDRKGNQLGVLVATQTGFNQLFSTFHGAASFSVSSVANEPAGWEMNTIQIGPIDTAYIAMGDSYSSGEGTRNFPWSQSQGTQCDTGPLAWPVQMADAQNNAHPQATLTIGPDTLVACQGETSEQLVQAVNNEAASEIDQVKNYVAKNGPPDLVTLTIGGNDLGFANILGECFVGGTEVCLHAVGSLNKKVTSNSGALISTLIGAYQEVQAAAGQDAQVAIVGYPNLFPQPGGLGRALSVTFNCPWLRDTFSFLTPLLTVSPFINRLLGNISNAQAALNDDMAAAAAAVGVQFIPIPASLSGHELCTGDSYLNALSPFEAGLFNNNRNSGHPTVAGSQAMASAVGSGLGLSTGAAPHGVAVLRALLRQLVTGSGTLGFSGGKLINGTIGATYFDFLISSGGRGRQSWSITKGKLPPGLSLSKADGTIAGIPAKAGTYKFTAQVSDPSAIGRKTASGRVTITVNAVTPLAVRTTKPPVATTGQAYFIALAARGGLGSMTWAVTKGALPPGLSLNAATGEVSGTPRKAGSFSFTVSATDSTPHRHKVARAALSIVVDPASAPVKVTTTALQKVTAGTDYAGQLTSTGGKAPVTWTISSGSLPPGVSLDQATGILSGTPTTPGTYHFTAQVSDATTPTPRTASAALSIAVAKAPALAISTTMAFNGAEGTYYSSTLQATGGVSPYSWFISSGSLPAGLNIDSQTGQITGVPTGTGKSTFQVTVDDSAGNSAVRTYTNSITRVRLTVSSRLTPATVGTYYTSNVVPSGGMAPYFYTLVSGKVPGLTFDSATGAFVGTPTRRGAFHLKVTVTDSSLPTQHVTASLTLNVAKAPKLTISHTTPVSGAVGTPYTTGIGFAGGRAPYTWAVKSGKLPPGLHLAVGSGMITGTPTRRGTFRATIRLTDSTTPTHQVVTATFTFTIRKVVPLTVAKPALPLSTQGTTYLAAFQAIGGVPPYNWTISAGAPPAGLNLTSTGEIFGTPTGSGKSAFTVSVTDSAAHPVTATRKVSLTVLKAAPLEILTNSVPNATENLSYEAQLFADGGAGPYLWTLTRGKLPSGLGLDPSGFIVGDPVAFGTFNITVQATDSQTPKPVSVKRTLTLIVEPPG